MVDLAFGLCLFPKPWRLPWIGVDGEASRTLEITCKGSLKSFQKIYIAFSFCFSMYILETALIILVMWAEAAPGQQRRKDI